MRYGLDGGAQKTLDEVGHYLEVTRERVRQIELRALKKLRHLGPMLPVPSNGDAIGAGVVEQIGA